MEILFARFPGPGLIASFNFFPHRGPCTGHEKRLHIAVLHLYEHIIRDGKGQLVGFEKLPGRGIPSSKPNCSAEKYAACFFLRASQIFPKTHENRLNTVCQSISLLISLSRVGRSIGFGENPSAGFLSV
jgi:hypothetical protein